VLETKEQTSNSNYFQRADSEVNVTTMVRYFEIASHQAIFITTINLSTWTRILVLW